MVHRTFLSMIGEEKLKNPSLISMQCAEGAHGEQRTTKAFFISFLFFLIYRRFISRFFPPFFLFLARLQMSLTIVKPR